jgi:ABC-type sugar transport system substrate-binding protein
MWVLAAVLAVLALVAVGCGDDDEEPSGAGGAAENGGGGSSGPVKFEAGQEFKSVFIPKQTGIAVFDQANEGAKEAAGELQVDPAEFLGPSSPDNCVSSQIDTVTNAATQGVKGVMISNCAGDQIEPAVNQAADAGAAVSRGTRLSPPARARACSSPRSTSTRPAP